MGWGRLPITGERLLFYSFARARRKVWSTAAWSTTIPEEIMEWGFSELASVDVKKAFACFSQGKSCLIHGIAFCNGMSSSAISQYLKSWLPRGWWCIAWRCSLLRCTVGGWGIMVKSWNTTGYKEGNVQYESTSALEQPRDVMKSLFASLTGLSLEQSGRLN